MNEPKIADTKPHVLKLEPGTYWWCACGRSASQPFCDGSHAGTGLEPVAVTLDEPKTVALCLCKQTSNKPLCDGTHSKLG
jgi:CDGSH-type Zn-finger protein